MHGQQTKSGHRSRATRSGTESCADANSSEVAMPPVEGITETRDRAACRGTAEDATTQGRPLTCSQATVGLEVRPSTQPGPRLVPVKRWGTP